MNQRSLYRCYFLLVWITIPILGFAQVLVPDPNTSYYLFHSSGNVVGENAESRAIIQNPSNGKDQLVQFVPDGSGYYWVKLLGQQKYMALSGSWNTYFISDSTTDASKYSIEPFSSTFMRLKCKANGKYLGTDNTTSLSNIYSDKSGTDSKHYWYISKEIAEIPVDTFSYLINPNATFTNTFEGWGVSLCWWANMCGNWSDNKIDEVVDWLVSPNGLNYNIFRYNIGGGDDPQNRYCDPHHMGNGKGLRAEIEGFKDSSGGEYIWSRDAAQRKIMLKIKEKRPDAIFEAFSNSAPYYMTYSGCVSGNVSASQDNLNPEFYTEFAHYLVDVCQFYKDSFNIEFKTLEPFNEPVTNYWAANGGQEGCHFSTTAQIAFLKILSPVLKASDLKTSIASSDETSAAQSVASFKAYVQDGNAVNLVDQWNAHTYSATHKDRANLRALSTANNKTLWMSEVGSGGSGISGNLNLAQKLIDDIRYIRPEAWMDWQYIEENNDQWCTVKANFSAQSYYRVKNYFIRQQFSQFIPKGSRFINVPNDQMLAAINPDNNKLVIVLLNKSTSKVSHKIDLSLVEQEGMNVMATRTSINQNNSPVSDYSITDSTLTLVLPKESITTLVIPISATSNRNEEIKTDVPYLILPRIANWALQSSGKGIEINPFVPGDSTQLWKLKTRGNGYILENLTGKMLTDNGSYFCEASGTVNQPGQVFQLESVGDDCYKIISSRTGKALDLEGEANAKGTKVGLYSYGNSPAASHRQWMLVLPPFLKSTNAPNDLEQVRKRNNLKSIRVLGKKGAIDCYNNANFPVKLNIYCPNGIRVLQYNTEGIFSHIPLKPGIYIVSSCKADGTMLIPTKVWVR